MDSNLMDILVCPVTKAPLVLDRDNQELLCKASALAYPVRDDIPILLEQQARPLSDDELRQL